MTLYDIFESRKEIKEERKNLSNFIFDCILLTTTATLFESLAGTWLKPTNRRTNYIRAMTNTTHSHLKYNFETLQKIQVFMIPQENEETNKIRKFAVLIPLHVKHSPSLLCISKTYLRLRYELFYLFRKH